MMERPTAGAFGLIAPALLIAAAAFLSHQERPGGPSGAAAAGALPAPPRSPSTVVAELFTSEGCSSCPPADELLAAIIHDSPVPGVEVLGLGEHVDYWDRLGWRDRFSSPAFSERQAEYQAHVFPRSAVYTPQLVIDGRFEVVGSEAAAVRRAIARAAGEPKARISVRTAALDRHRVEARVEVDASPELPQPQQAELLVAIAQDGVASRVERGENRGRTLQHAAVVRRLTTLGRVTGSERRLAKTAVLPVSADWPLADLRIAAILQERDSRRIIGAASAAVGPVPPLPVTVGDFTRSIR